MQCLKRKSRQLVFMGNSFHPGPISWSNWNLISDFSSYVIFQGSKSQDSTVRVCSMTCKNNFARLGVCLYAAPFFSVISNTRDSVSLACTNTKTRVENMTCREYFREILRCLDSWWNTVLSVWYIFSIETKTLGIQISFKVVIFFVFTWLMSSKFEKYNSYL